MNNEKKKMDIFLCYPFYYMFPSKQTPFGICFSSSADGFWEEKRVEEEKGTIFIV
jgi:hypothetical protein